MPADPCPLTVRRVPFFGDAAAGPVVHETTIDADGKLAEPWTVQETGWYRFELPEKAPAGPLAVTRGSTIERTWTPGPRPAIPGGPPPVSFPWKEQDWPTSCPICGSGSREVQRLPCARHTASAARWHDGPPPWHPAANDALRNWMRDAGRYVEERYRDPSTAEDWPALRPPTSGEAFREARAAGDALREEIWRAAREDYGRLIRHAYRAAKEGRDAERGPDTPGPSWRSLLRRWRVLCGRLAPPGPEERDR